MAGRRHAKSSQMKQNRCQNKCNLFSKSSIYDVQSSFFGSYRHQITHLSRFDRRNLKKTAVRKGRCSQLHFVAISRCSCSTFYLILAKRSRLCDAVYSLQSRIKRDFSVSLLIARNEAREIGLKMADSAAPSKSAFRFPLRYEIGENSG